MKLPNGYGSVVKLSGKRRKPYMVQKTTGYHIDPIKEKKVADYIIIGYTATKAEGLQMLADYNATADGAAEDMETAMTVAEKFLAVAAAAALLAAAAWMVFFRR